MNNTRILLAGIAVTLLVAGGVVGAFRHRGTVESPEALLRQAIGEGSPKDQARAAARLATRPGAGGTDDTIVCLKEMLTKGRSPEVRATAVVGLARTGDRSTLPLLVEAIEDDDPLVAGRAVAAVQHLLGVRYGTEERPFDREERRRVADMARADVAALDGPGRAWWEAHIVPGATW